MVTCIQNKKIRVIKLDEYCYIYDCDNFKEYRLNQVAYSIIHDINIGKGIDEKYKDFVLLLNKYNIIQIKE